MKKNLLIIIPVYNEQNNIKPIVLKIFKEIKRKVNILFIDDNSQDKTRSQIYLSKKKYKEIYLIKRGSKLGIGSAHKCGLKWGYLKKYKTIVTMDCDGTHHPKYIIKMLNTLKKNNFDIISTNRFLKKNSLKGWSPWRKYFTILRQTVIKFLLNINYDSSGAYRCYNVKKVKLNHILLARDNGYSFFWQSIFLLHKKRYKIFEIPIYLPPRSHGSSKMKLKDVVSTLFYLLVFYFKNH